jgi:hypothetical protein
MSGIQLPIGIETVNPVDADYKRGPWPTYAAALAGIPFALRYNQLTFYVIGDPNEYYWLDTNLADGGVLIRATGGGGTVSFNWKFDTSTAAVDPGTGRFRLNNANPALATAMYVDSICDQTGFNIDTLFGSAAGTYSIYMQQDNSPTQFIQFTTTGGYTNNGGWWTIPITGQQVGAGGLFTNNRNCTMFITNKNSGGTASILDITRVGLQGLITGNTVIKGQQYAITDFQDRDITDPATRLVVMGTSTNSISQSGSWVRLTNNKPFSSWILSSGAAGSVDQVTVGATTLMTASVPYAVSRFATLTAAAANINANSGVSGYRAVVIQGDANIDQPAMVVEQLLAGLNISTVIVAVTTLVAASVSVMGMGQAPVQQVLDIDYNITLDRITRCYEEKYQNEMKYTVPTLTTLGYNPIVQFRWGHNNFRKWSLTDVDYTNVFISSSLTGTRTIESNNRFINGFFKNIISRRTSTLQRPFSDNYWSVASNNSTSGVNNVQGAAQFVMNGNTAEMIVGPLTATSILLFDNTGTGRIFLALGASSSISITGNALYASQIGFGGGTFLSFGQIAISSNVINGGQISTGAAVSVWSQPISITACTITNGLALATNSDYRLTIDRCTIYEAVLGLTMSVPGKTVSLSRCTLESGVSISGIKTDNFTLTRTTIGAQTSILGAHGLLVITDSVITKPSVIGAINFGTMASIDISFSVLRATTILLITGTSMIMVGAQIFGSSITNGTSYVLSNLFMTGTDISSNDVGIYDSNIKSSTLNNSITAIDNSTIESCLLVTAGTLTIQSSTVSSVDSTAMVGPTDSIISNNSQVNNVILNTVGGTYGNITFQDSQVANSIFGFGNDNVGGVAYSACTILNSVIYTAHADTINASFFINCSFKFTEIDLGVDLEGEITWNAVFCDRLALTRTSTATTSVWTNVHINSIGIDNAFNGTFNMAYCNFTGELTLSQTSAWDVNYTSIDRGRYLVRYNHNFSVNPLTAGSTVKATTLLSKFALDKITYTSNGALLTGGAGASLSVGFPAGNNQYIAATTLVTINGISTNQDTTLVNLLASDQDLNIAATVANVTGGHLLVILEGVLLNNANL